MRHRIATLTLVLVALLALATPAPAINEYLCAGVPSASFGDVPVTSPFKPFIDCLVFFEITSGTAPGTYSPGSPVERWQMAIFLQRVWQALGNTAVSGDSQGFTDIGSLSHEAQTAINQTSRMSVTSGVELGLYGPLQPVPRWQMAIFLARFARAAGTLVPPPASTDFTDIASLTIEAQDAISSVQSLGITTGTSATTFSPHDLVTREQMAAFLIRTLQATWFLGAGDFTDNCSTDSQGVETCTGSGDWFASVPLRFLHGWVQELPNDSTAFDDSGTKVDFFIDGVLQTATEHGLALPGIKFRWWEVLTPAGLTGSHTLEARYYLAGVLTAVDTATVSFS